MNTQEPQLRPVEALRVDLDLLEPGASALAVELPAAWVADVLDETDAQVEQGGAALLELTLQADRTLLVRGTIELSYAVPCARCLDPAEVDVGRESSDLCVTFVPAERLRSWAEYTGPEGGEDEIEPLEPSELDEIGYEGSTVELRGLITEQILLAYPIRALCSRGEACLGLCMRCGTELNSAAHGGAAPERCPACGLRLDGVEDDPADTPWKRALAKVKSEDT